MSGKEKPVKIRSYNSSNKYGVTAKNVKELLDKGCKLLKVRPASKRFLRPFIRAVVKVVFRLPNTKKDTRIAQMSYSPCFASVD